MGVTGKKGHEPNYPAASEMCLDVTADRAAPGALEICCSRTFFSPFLKYIVSCFAHHFLSLFPSMGLPAELCLPFYLSLAPAWFVPLVASLPGSFTSTSTSVLLQSCRKCSDNPWQVLSPVPPAHHLPPGLWAVTSKLITASLYWYFICTSPYTLFQGLTMHFCFLFKVTFKQCHF